MRCIASRQPGANGFEGLVQAHVGRLTGHSFFLAKSGAQAGKDSSTAGYGATYIDIECKRYPRGKSPTARELIGGFHEAINASVGRLDLWLLASTGAIGTTGAEALRQEADREAVAVEIIDWQKAGLPQLGVLCAAFSEETLAELQARGASGNLAVVTTDLKAIKNDPGFAMQFADLRHRLSAADLGLDHARAVANAWIEARLANKTRAMAAFRQPLCVEDASFQPYVERVATQASLKAWYAAWPEHHRFAAILGREGNGKSWATMAWWKALDARPLTLMITSNRVTESDVLTLVASALVVQTNVRDIEFWKRHVQRWLQRPPSATPTLLLVLDGLNERPGQAWDEVFASLAESAWAGRLAIVITCRPAFWSERVTPILSLPFTPIEVQRFDHEELARAWGDRRPALSEIPETVREFIRTPRIFRMARDHVEHLMQSGDPTVERLLIEDWRDRRRHKLGFAHSVTEFNNLVIDLARDLRQGLREFGRHQLRNYSSLAYGRPDRDLDRDFDEIIDGQLFEPVDSVSGRYRVRAEHVGLALGMVLAREARDAHRELGAAGVETILAEALDTVADLDQTSAVFRGACAVACLEPEYPAEARRILLRGWLCCPNLEEAQSHDFAAYLPLHPDTYFDLAEDFWLGEDINPTGREWVTDVILRWRGLPVVQALIATRCERWLGLWHTDWHPFAGKPDAERLARRREIVSENWSRLTDSEYRWTDHFLSQALTPHAPFIARLALLLISHGPHLPHVDGFVGWALSRAIMRLPDEIEEVAWCLRMNGFDAAETEVELLMKVEVLLEHASDVGIRAARHLLWACGTPASAARLAVLPAQPPVQFWSRPRLIEVDPLDPAAPAPADLSSVIDRLAALDPGNFWNSLGVTAEEHQFDELEPILARFAPLVVSGFYRRSLQSAPEREGISLRQLGWQIPKLLILIGPEEAHALDQARRSLLPLLDSDVHDASVTEAYMLTGLLGRYTPEEQLDLLLQRPESALDLDMFEHLFADVPDELANGRIVRTAAEGHAHEIRRLLWVLRRSAFTLSEEARNALIRCFTHMDPGVRACAFRVADTCKDRAALNVHVASEWRAPSDDTTVEPLDGSRALIAGANPVDYLALRSRVAPELLGYLALRDGSPRAIDAFAEDLDALREIMTRTPLPPDETARVVVSRVHPTDLVTPEVERAGIEPGGEAALRTIRVFGRGPSANEVKNFFEQLDPDAWIHQRRDFEERLAKLIAEARRAGHHFFGQRMRGYALPEVIKRHPELVEKWIAFLEGCDTVPWDTAEFYRALCGALGAIDPDRAADLLARLRRASTVSRLMYRPWNIDSLTWLAFKLPSSQKVDEVREHLLEEANTDELLFQIALTAQATGATDWLARVIGQDLVAPGVHRAARALTLIGFLDEGTLLDEHRHQLGGRTGFLKDVASCAGVRLEQNHRARAWFAEFLRRRDPVDAWAAFRLFLCCVDRRFYLWSDAVRNGTPDLPLLWHQQVRINDQDIRRAAEKNEGKLSEILFGLRISKNAIAPWYRTPPMANTV